MTTPATPGLLAGRLALVTGAGSGIGRAITVAYAAAGAAVVLTDREEGGLASSLAAARAAAGDGGSRLWAHRLDVTDSVAVHALAERVNAEAGDLDVLVNNAGLIIREGIDSPVVEDNVRQMMEVNYFGAFHMIHAFLPALRRRQGCIVNIASGAALLGHAGAMGYSGSKGALRLLTQSLAAELGRDGVRVNALAPGVIETPMTESTRADPRRLKGFLSRVPLRRLGRPEEVAGPAVFLASALASYVNGSLLVADGGLHAW